MKKCTKISICSQMKIHVFLDFSHPKSFKTSKKLCNILDLLIYSTLRQIIREVVKEELPYERMDSAEKKLRRKFEKLIQLCGGDMNKLYCGRGQISFPTEEKEFIKIILIQLAREEGLSYKIWENKDESMSLKEAHDFIQYFINYLEKKGYSEADIKGVVIALDMMFQLSVREKLDYCHRMIDCYAENLTPYLYTYQVRLLDDLAKKLAAESVCSTVNAAIHCSELAEVLKMGMELGETDDVRDLYGEDDNPVYDEYVERDKQVLLYMKKRKRSIFSR